MKDGKSLGSERMWKQDGTPYISHFYSEPGVVHGIQERYFSNGILARNAKYNNGTLIYEIFYNRIGDIVSQKGEIPEEQ